MLKKIITVVLTAAALGLSAMAAAPATAGAAPCVDEGCNGRDPQGTGCSRDARTLETLRNPGGYPVTVDLRYSPSCYAAWTRITNPIAASGQAKVIGYVNGFFIREELKTLGAYNNEVAWTNMISFTYTVYGCYRYYHPDGPLEWCTGPH